MAAPVFSTPRRTHTTSDFKVVAAVAIFILAATFSLVALAFDAPGSVDPSSSRLTPYGEGYPLHGGLAGPSRVSIFEIYSRGDGYPLHGGLAGPSRVATVEHFGYGAGYPLHGGLAGPSRLDDGD